MVKMPTLFHGTDARIVRMDYNERKKYRYDCLCVLDYLWPYVEPYSYGLALDDELKSLLDHNNNLDLFNRVKRSMSMVRAMYNNHSQYQYQEDTIYLTCIRDCAEGFARRSKAGGELGMITYDLIEASTLISFKEWDPYAAVISVMGHISSFANGVSEPVIFEFKNLNVKNLVTDTDQIVELPDNELFIYPVFRSVRSIVPLCLNLDDAIPV